jgi:AcrR family transcriptional regulator
MGPYQLWDCQDFGYREGVATTQGPGAGRRERKKAATRNAIAEAAMRLFVERGYDRVTVREVAEEADVSATTLLNYFPTKESLVFDRAADIEASLVRAIVERALGVSPLAALRAHVQERVTRATSAGGDAARFRALVQSALPLVHYERDQWLRHQDVLAAALAEGSGLPADDQGCRLVAAFALQTLTLAFSAEKPLLVVDLAFDLIERGWQQPMADHKAAGRLGNERQT